jgi:carboxyl-terminal processing protease
VQTLIDLNRYVPGEQNNLGRLRLTMAEFFRISGGSTQLRGVEPDIRFPTADFMVDYGERSLDNALPWTRIRAADYQKVGSVAVELLALQSAERVSRDPGFAMLMERSKFMRDIEEQTHVSLKEQARREEDERRGSVFKEQQNNYLRARGIAPVDEDDEQVDEDLLEAQREVIARIQVDEAARILADSILLGRADRTRAVMRD